MATTPFQTITRIVLHVCYKELNYTFLCQKNWVHMARSLQLFIRIIFSQDHYGYSYANAIQLPNVYTLQDRRIKHGTISAIGVPNFVQLWTLQIWEFLLRIWGTSAHLMSTHPVNCPSDRYASATKLVCRNGDIFRRQAIFHIKCCSFIIVLNPVNYVT
jgi:hypothetical protein